jgi:hypothetical protein
MYLHLGGDVCVKTESIVGIFDLDSASASKYTKDFLTSAQKNGQIFNVSYELPKSFVVCRGEKGAKIVYLAQISSATLLKRANLKSGGLSDSEL